MPQAGYVYIVHGVDTSYVKVGKTTNIVKRLLALGQGVPFQLQLLYTELVNDMDEGERTLQKRYASFHTRGEWFELPIDILQQWPIGGISLKTLHTLVPPVPLPERLLQLITGEKGCTARELARRMRAYRAHDVRHSMVDLIAQGHIVEVTTGKRVEYLRVIRQDDTEAAL